MANYIAGPWEFLEDGCTESEGNAGRPLTIYDAAGSNDLANVFSADDSTTNVTRAEAIAIARLIAAAPDLLSALIAMERLFGHFGDAGAFMFPEGHPVTQARAAIARATGSPLRALRKRRIRRALNRKGVA